MYSEKHCIITVSGPDCYIEGKCLLTDKNQVVKVKTEDYEKWTRGEGNINELMPYLSQSEKHFLSTGVTDEGWDELNQNINKIAIPKAK